MQNRLLAVPIQLSRDSAEPYKQQIANGIERLIATGRLHAHDQLPSINELTAQLGVSKNTVLGAYELLYAAGLVRSEHRRGVFVEPGGPCMGKPVESARAQPVPAPSAAPAYADAAKPPPGSGVHAQPPAMPVRFDFKIGRPAASVFPAQRWAELSSRLLRQMSRAIAEYTPAEGLWGLRMQLADHLSASKGFDVEPEQIVIVSGSQEALSLLTAHCLGEGDEAVMEAPGYTGFSRVLDMHRAKITRIPVDSQGLQVDALPQRPVRLAYVTPSHQYPLGYELSLPRRRQLLEWAAANGTLIIEDDYDGEFRYENTPLPPLAALDPSRVVYLGTFSKTLGPGLRLGYMVCPPALVDAIIRRKALLNNGCPWLEQAVMTRYIEAGEYSRHLHALRRRYHGQRDCLLGGLDRIWGTAGRVSGQHGGMHVAFHLLDGSEHAADVAQKALACGVRLYTLPEAASGGSQDVEQRALLFGYASMDSEAIEQALERLAAVPQVIGRHHSVTTMRPFISGCGPQVYS
ncbi:MocR-like pyridoxine biosynthesis transcription factor PdxR [Thauera sp. Sel9]|uniref:MocR-like pyridoxine biosynthesis transcription factor PdxR n=1 Tax=Thauera sp. Sel9 TaxID=2974299 RepID=UPI0021E164FC|nr:PLP-dependent aminotransferase family protein [Thauera sp. Sel9]MCV2216650.1 PLP-dependent aminotransferase family protein [Thauera sp. Sel9]